MAIQNRRGLKKDFDPNKLLPAEYGIPTDTKEVYVAFAPGDVKRMATWDDFNAEMGAVADATERANTASEYAESLVVNKAGINDTTPTLTEAYSGAKVEELVAGIEKISIIQTDIVNDATKVPSSVVTNALGKKIDVLTNNYASLLTTNADAKNSIYRGKYLGNVVTAEQYLAISSGTFNDLYIGDYWTIGGVNWRIAAFNYYTNTGDALVSKNHITIVPDTLLYNHVMNDTDITTGGYTGSKMYTTGLGQAKTTIKGIFGAHLIKHRQVLSNATVDGKANGWAWIDSEVELMSEPMVYGSIIWGESSVGGSGYNIGVGKSQLPLFALNPRMINTGQNYWLRDVVSTASFAIVSRLGYAYAHGASLASGVRPAFSIS